jgi:hypothetical protein
VGGRSGGGVLEGDEVVGPGVEGDGWPSVASPWMDGIFAVYFGPEGPVAGQVARRVRHVGR